MHEQRIYQSGKISGYIYRFDEPGRGLNAHKHEPDSMHNIIVLSGVVKFISEEIEVVLSSGDIWDFDGSKVHQVDILEAPAKLLNLYI